MNVRIYKPSKSAMQSGRGKTQKWHLEYETETARAPEPLMGWVSSGDTLNQVVLKFDTQKDAIAYAEKRDWSYTVTEPHTKKVKPRNYADNFVFDDSVLSSK